MSRRKVGARLAIALAAGATLLQAGGTGLRPQEAAPESPSVQKIQVNGVELAYVEQGRGEPVVFIHGFLLDYRVWAKQWPEISTKFRAIAYSQRYRWPGQPPAKGALPSEVEDLDDLVAFIQELKLGPIHLVGHSAGAALALQVARDYPRLVRSMVLAEPGPNAFALPEPPARPPGRPPWRNEMRQAYEAGDIDRAMQILSKAIVGEEAAARPPQAWVEQIFRANIWQITQVWTPFEAEPPVTCGEAREMKIPVLLLGGDRSPPIFPMVLDALQKCLPAAERAVLPDASHGLEMDNPAGFNRIVLDFLARHAPR